MVVSDICLPMDFVYWQQSTQSLGDHARDAIGSRLVVGVAVLIAQVDDELDLFIDVGLKEF